jgi:hypothetical protein
MEIKIKIPKYDPNEGFITEWEYGFEIETKIDDGIIVLTANKPGLVSLATQLLALAQDEIPPGCHLHFDENNSLEDGSLELIVEKK